MPNTMIKNFSDKSGKSENEVEKIWSDLKKQYGDDYQRIVGTLKKILKINESFSEFLRESNDLKSIISIYKEYFNKINIYEFNDKISIDLIVAKEKGTGKGTELMKALCEYADKNNKIIILTPSDEFGSSKSNLIKFYKKFGFIENKGSNKIFGIFEEMYRNPKK